MFEAWLLGQCGLVNLSLQQGDETIQDILLSALCVDGPAPAQIDNTADSASNLGA